MPLRPSARRNGLTLGAICVAAAACAGSATEPDATDEWGAPHLAMVLTEDGGTLEYDCAHGTIDAGWTVSAEGLLTGTGQHFQERGGPIAEDEVLEPRPASYEGLLRGDDLRLTITLTDSAQVLGTFDLRRGETGPVFKCL